MSPAGTVLEKKMTDLFRGFLKKDLPVDRRLALLKGVVNVGVDLIGELRVEEVEESKRKSQAT